MRTPYKMKGSPMQRNFGTPLKYDKKTGLSLTKTGVSTTLSKGSKPSQNITVSPGIRLGDFRAGVTGSKTYTGGIGSKLDLGARASYTIAPKKNFTTGFKGQLSGGYNKKSQGSAKLSLGIEKSGGEYCKGGKLCSDASTEFGVTGNYNSKNKSVSVGAKVRRGMMELSGSHNLKTKQNKITLGIKPFK